MENAPFNEKRNAKTAPAIKRMIKRRKGKHPVFSFFYVHDKLKLVRQKSAAFETLYQACSGKRTSLLMVCRNFLWKNQRNDILYRKNFEAGHQYSMWNVYDGREKFEIILRTSSAACAGIVIFVFNVIFTIY